MVMRAVETEPAAGANLGAAPDRGGEGGTAEQVLLFSFNYPPHDGGVARLCAELVAGLQRRGVDVRVLSQHRHGPGSRIPSAPERRVTTRRPWRELAALRKLRHMAPNALIICGLWYPEGLLATLAGVRPRVILAHGLELRPTRQRWRRQVWSWLMRLVLHRAALVVANSRYTEGLVHVRAPKATVAALPLGVDHRRFRPGDQQEARRRLAVPERKRVLATVSRIVRHKGHRLVFQALAALPEAARDSFVYLVAGQGPDLARLQQEAQALGLGHVVRWLGYVPEADLPELYRSADLFALCTREDPDQPDVEGFGLAFLEAQACGIPVVGTRTGGIPDAIADGRGGWLIDQNDTGALTSLLARLVDEPAHFRQMGRTARQRVECECTWEHHVDRLLRILDERGLPLTRSGRRTTCTEVRKS